jgi:hypothetical protein
MSSEIRAAYRAKPDVLGIFPVAAYNGGGRNVAKLYRALNRMVSIWPNCARRQAATGIRGRLPLCLARGGPPSGQRLALQQGK